MLAACVAGIVLPSESRAQSRQSSPEDLILVQVWAEDDTVIASPMVGLIERMPTRLGMKFSKGAELIRFQCTENEARAAIALSEHTAAAENLEAKIRLKAMNAASEIEVTLAASQVAKADAQLKLTRHQASQCVVRAPYDGYVVRLMGKPFQTATVGQPMIEIISAGTPRLRLIADSRHFAGVRVGSRLEVLLKESPTGFGAVVSLINARIDPVNQTFEMEARLLGQPSGVLPGMSGYARITGETASVRGQSPPLWDPSAPGQAGALPRSTVQRLPGAGVRP